MIGFTGGSAGGHLTAHVSTAFAARAYARVDASDDVSCRPDFSIFQYPCVPSALCRPCPSAICRPPSAPCRPVSFCPLVYPLAFGAAPVVPRR